MCFKIWDPNVITLWSFYFTCKLQTDLSHLLMTLYEQIFSVWKVLIIWNATRKCFLVNVCLRQWMTVYFMMAEKEINGLFTSLGKKRIRSNKNIFFVFWNFNFPISNAKKWTFYYMRWNAMTPQRGIINRESDSLETEGAGVGGWLSQFFATFVLALKEKKTR